MSLEAQLGSLQVLVSTLPGTGAKAFLGAYSEANSRGPHFLQPASSPHRSVFQGPGHSVLQRPVFSFGPM